MRLVMQGMTIAYEEYGSGPAVLFLGDLSAESGGTKKHIQSLVSAGFRVVIQNFSLAGHPSELAADRHVAMRSEAVVGLLNYLGIGRVALVGRSTSKQVLQALLQRFPQRVAAVVIAGKSEHNDSCRRGKGLEKPIRSQGQGRVKPADGESEAVGHLLEFLHKLKEFGPRQPLLLQMS